MPGSLGLPEKLLFQGKFSECADKEDSLRPLQIAADGWRVEISLPVERPSTNSLPEILESS